MKEPLYPSGEPSDEFTVGQIAQLYEIDRTRVKRGEPGIGGHVQELIKRLTDGGVAGKYVDIRMAQAKRYWDLGVGKVIFFGNFAAYLDSIPEIPVAVMKRHVEMHGSYLVLCETRLGLKPLCDLGNIEFAEADHFVRTDDDYAEFEEPSWFVMEDGRRNRNRSVKLCYDWLEDDELGLTALQGVCSYLQHQSVLSEMTKDGAHAMDLLGSVDRYDQVRAANLRLEGGKVILDKRWIGESASKFGSATRRECKC